MFLLRHLQRRLRYLLLRQDVLQVQRHRTVGLPGDHLLDGGVGDLLHAFLESGWALFFFEAFVVFEIFEGKGFAAVLEGDVEVFFFEFLGDFLFAGEFVSLAGVEGLEGEKLLSLIFYLVGEFEEFGAFAGHVLFGDFFLDFMGC